MIEKMFPQTVSNIIDYDAIKAAAKKYVEDVFVEIVKSFGDNLILQTMDEAHLAEVSKHVAGDSRLSVEELLSYMNTDNIYRESEFVSDLLTAFPSGVEYLEFEVTGWKFPQVNFAPFSEPERSYNYDGTPISRAGDDVWMDNAFNGDYVNNLLLSRYKGQFGPNNELNWHKKSGRRSSWGDAETWMTTGGFGKPASIHINVDEERTVLEENGLSSVENWLGTVANKLPINLYIEINDIFKTNGEDTAGSTNGYRQSFPYAEGEGFCTNDPAMAVSPNTATVTHTVSYLNTQLPDVQIELPESETVEDGYSIILPTMTGEYESGGKTWKPTAWDIGAFGDSYTPNADTVAHLVFEEVETQEIDIDVNFGDPVTIPAGYSVQSVKSSTAYAFAEDATGSAAGVLWFTVRGKNYYFNENDTSLLGYKTSPCLQLYQYTSDTGGNWITSRSSQSPGLAIMPDQSRCILNGTRNQLSLMLYFYANGPSGVSSIGTAINGRKYALQMRRYDANDAFVTYYFNVPMVIWRYIDGVFSWQGDATATKSLAYWYTKTASTNTFRIHCVKGTLPSLYKIGWFKRDKSNEYVNTGTAYDLYDENGTKIPYDSTKSYTFLWCVRGKTVEVSIPASSFRTLYMSDHSGYLQFCSETGGYAVGLASHIYYVET